MNVFQKAKILAKTLDEQNKSSAPIRVRSSRGYMMSLGLKPQERGQPLFINDHPVICEHGKCTQQN